MTSRASLPEHVDDLLHAGRPTEAKRAIARAADEIVPELPHRWTVVLTGVSPARIRRIVKSVASKKRAPLDLRLVGVTRPRAVIAICGGGTIGVLSDEDSAFLASLGDAALSYRPRVLAIRATDGDDAQLSVVEIELVRAPQRRREEAPLALHQAIDSVLAEEASAGQPPEWSVPRGE